MTDINEQGPSLYDEPVFAEDISPVETFKVSEPTDEMIAAHRAIFDSMSDNETAPVKYHTIRLAVESAALIVGLSAIVTLPIMGAGALFQGERPTLEPIPAEIDPQIGDATSSPTTTMAIALDK